MTTLNRLLARRGVLLCLACWVGPPVVATGQDLLNDNVTYADFDLDLVPYVTLPGSTSHIISMTTQPGLDRLFVSTQEGAVYSVGRTETGVGDASLWFDVRSALQSATGKDLNYQNFPHGGLRAVAFHPDFSDSAAPGYGKFYASVMHGRPDDPQNHVYLGASVHGGGVGADSAVFEFSYDFAAQQVDPGSTRELFRVNMPVYDHPIKQIEFNKYARPGDEDYGFLYIAHGDASVQSAIAGGGQNTDDVLGKMLRINPLQDGASSYTTPSANPFVGDPGVLDEIYALGFRNPHTFSFNQDAQGQTYLINADAGRDNIEELNLVMPGRNYGWSDREGTFVHKPSGGYINGVDPLPANEASLVDYVYPVAQIDHSTGAISTNPGDGFVGFAITSGHTIRNAVDPALNGKLFYSNFGFAGDIYAADLDEMLGAVIDLDPNDPSRDSPEDLTWAESHLVRLALDHDNDPGSSPQVYDNFNELLQASRSDTWFGEGVLGEMYISSKTNGTVYLVRNSLPSDPLKLIVDRASGGVTLAKLGPSAYQLDGITIQSPSGSLGAGGFQAAGAGWTFSASNGPTKLTQLLEDGSLQLDSADLVSLGDVFEPRLVSFGGPVSQDLQFTYTGPDGEVRTGYVEYVGESPLPNTIVLTVDLATGHAIMLNQTPFAQEVEAYTISSVAGSLDAAGWTTLEAQGVDSGDWSASQSSSGFRLTELQEDGTTTFDDTTPFSLGEVLASSGPLDLRFEFLLAGELDARLGIVEYLLGGDYNDDGVVDAADYTVWRDHRGMSTTLPNDLTPGMVTDDDYDVWRNAFGASLDSLLAAHGVTLAVPEPCTVLAAAVACLLQVVARRQPVLVTLNPAAGRGGRRAVVR